MKRTTFFLKRGDRLIARLKLMYYAMRFADQIDGRIVMIWPSLPVYWHQFDGADYSPSLIFDLAKFYSDGGGDRLIFLEGNIPFPQQIRSLRDPEFAAMRPGKFDRDYFLSETPLFHEQNAPLYSFAHEPKDRTHVPQTLQACYARLPHEATMTAALFKALQLIGSHDYVALHVRRGDIVEMMKADLPKLADGSLSDERLALLMGHYVRRTALDEFYYRDIEDAILCGRRIIYFSDSPSSVDHFASIFGAEHFIDGTSFKARYPIQKAFLDFNLILGAKTIISTGSNFASFAATLGGGQLVNVAVNGPVDAMERHLHDEYLKDVGLDAQAKARLRAELVNQYTLRIGPARARKMAEEANALSAG